jgi:UDP-N-acetylmuramoyl-L-alanyl-D-glutamate--2,6-diaminopimelate ligase
VINAHDTHAKQLAASARKAGAEIRTYGIGTGDWRAASHELTPSGATIQLETPAGSAQVASRLAGEVNILNLLAALTAAHARGVPFPTLIEAVPKLVPVPGRFQLVDGGQRFTVIVDYAHTDDALRNTIAVARGMNPKRIITLFGCGGDRDRSKRPLMGQAAAEASDFVLLTSDNPRSEDPLAIMNDALVGIRRVDVPHVVEPDRAAAIARAIKEAREGDIVILAGKGHETYQILKDRTIAFDDREVAREVLKGYGYRKTS